jgi:Carboxypeptidase regulatory-like domain
MTPKTTHILAALVCCLLLAVTGFGQSVNATVGGNVSDASGALIPGVTVTATNVGTNIANTTVTNETGTYNFPALQPGTYKVSAELPGFQTQTFTDVQLGGAQQVKLNFNLQVGAAAGTNVEVTIAADTILATTSNSIGTVLPEYKLRELPSLTGNVFNLVANMPGVQRDTNGTFGFMAGGRLGDVNATRDGINVNDGRYENGAWSTVYTSPDMVEEVKVIVAPVDAETSRGNGQVQMVTRSGTNQYRGSVSWSNHNSALDANSWFNNFNGVGKSYDNRNLYSARMSGPIIKNKTFFFALFNGQRDLKKSQAAGLTWTDMAKAGIFRYWPGVDNQNASGNNPSVDVSGNPIAPAGATGPLSAIGLFGSCNYNGAPVPNCKLFNDPLRPGISNVPFIQETLKRMPSPNQFTSGGANIVGDGLNTAVVRFVRRQDGLDLTNGNGDEVNRDQYNLRIDHNFNSRHKVSIIGTHEKTWGTATQAGLRAWPQGLDGLAVKRPVVYTIQVSSTLSSTMLNQLRMGKSGSNNWQWGSADRGDEVGAEARKLLYYANGIPIGTFTWATGITSWVTKGGFGRWREGINPRYSIGDDVSWTVRKHAFKGGFEWRRTTSNGFNDPNFTPVSTLGAGSNGALLDSTPANGGFTGLSTNAANLAKNFLYDLTGQISLVNESFGILSAQDTKLQGYPVIPNNRHWNYQSEMSAYFKDDWKFRPDLTLNLGLHWEYYGQPYEHDGLAARVVGDENTFLNVQCAGTPGVVGSNLLPNGSPNCTNLATVQFVGKNSTNPNIGVNLRGNDYKSFAPSVGIAWNVPWFGKGKTVLRTGYGIAYSGALRNFINVDSSINSVPGVTLSQNGSGLNWNAPAWSATVPLTTLSNLSLPIPKPTGTPETSPFPITTTTRNLQLTTYAYTNPYTQNWNLEIQREVAKNTTVEIRYVGTKGTGLLGSVNINAVNYYRRDTAAAFFAAFDAARTGGESVLLNQLFNGVALTGGCGIVNGQTCTGAQALRLNTTTRQDLANGSYGSLLNRINTSLQFQGGGTDAGQILRRNGFPENYLTPDPQYSTINIQGNNQNSTYHSLNIQATRRLTNGFAATTTYIWSKALGDPTGTNTGATSPDPNNRHLIKTLQAVDRKHQISANGTYELPLGTNHLLFANAPGWMQNIVGKWQLGGIMNFATGAPLAFTTGPAINPPLQTITNINARPVAVGDLPSGKVSKVANGITFFDGYKVVTDPGFSQASPACAGSTSACNGLFAGYNLTGIQDPSGNFVMRNPGPGDPGGLPVVRGPKAMNFDVNLVKRIQITETKQFEIRIDAVNILNKANFAAPEENINNVNFGRITALRTELVGNGMRSFIINTRLNF